MKNIIFVSEICASKENTTSTHILTSGLIEGLAQTGNRLIFVAICETSEEPYLEEKYGKIVDRLIFLRRYCSTMAGKYKRLLQLYRYMLFGLSIKKEAYTQLSEYINEETILISHSPSLESVFVCKKIKDKYPTIRYIQYWSDPLALSGILPEQVGIKRVPFKWLEKYCYSKATEVVYGTKTLMHFQAKLFEKYQNKMRYVDWGYIQKGEMPQKKEKEQKFNIVYSGNYYSTIRNIRPLYNAMNLLDNDTCLNIYGLSDLILKNTRNVFVYKRISAEEIQEIERDADILIALLNTNCIQIPGKTFYNIDINQHILVILDGKYKEQLREYLETFDRFSFCENNEESIRKAIIALSETHFKIDRAVLKKWSPKNIALELISENFVN